MIAPWQNVQYINILYCVSFLFSGYSNADTECSQVSVLGFSYSESMYTSLILHGNRGMGSLSLCVVHPVEIGQLIIS